MKCPFSPSRVTDLPTRSQTTEVRIPPEQCGIAANGSNWPGSTAGDLSRAEDLQSQLSLSRNQSHLTPRAFTAHTDTLGGIRLRTKFEVNIVSREA